MIQDSGHRPHARHTNEPPENKIVEAPHHLSVTLDTWGPVDNLFPALYDALQSNWGDHPSRMVENDDVSEPEIWSARLGKLQRDTGWLSLSRNQQIYVDKCFKGETLPQVLERITFSFLIDGCTRAATHQIVRTRLGAAFMQHGGRDNGAPGMKGPTTAGQKRQLGSAPHALRRMAPIALPGSAPRNSSRLRP